ncbi:hypothetical protein BH24GEM3_BH24GEM3_03290 [soil metagenome]
MRPLVALLSALGFLLLPAVAAAQTWEDYDYENLAFRGLGVEIGSVWPHRVENTLSLGLRGDLGLLGPNLRIVPSLSLWSSHLRQSEVDRFASQIIRVCQRQQNAICPAQLDLGRIRLSDLALATDAHYLFINPFDATPYLGAGVGVHLLNGSGEFIDDTFIEELLDAISPALNLVGGVSVPLTNTLEVFGEARYILLSDVRHGALSVGGMWRIFPTPPPAPPRARRVR